MTWEALQEDMSVYFFDSPRTQHSDPKLFAYAQFEYVRKGLRERLSKKARFLQYAQLSKEVVDLREQLEQISDTKLRGNAIATTDEFHS